MLTRRVRCYSEAIRLKPDYVHTYINRRVTRSEKGDVVGTIADYTEAIRMDPATPRPTSTEVLRATARAIFLSLKSRRSSGATVRFWSRSPQDYCVLCGAAKVTVCRCGNSGASVSLPGYSS